MYDVNAYYCSGLPEFIAPFVLMYLPEMEAGDKGWLAKGESQHFHSYIYANRDWKSWLRRNRNFMCINSFSYINFDLGHFKYSSALEYNQFLEIYGKPEFWFMQVFIFYLVCMNYIYNIYSHKCMEKVYSPTNVLIYSCKCGCAYIYLFILFHLLLNMCINIAS